jgi:hypothetical protein
VGTHDGIFDVDRVVAHSAKDQRLVESPDNEDGVVVVWNVEKKLFLKRSSFVAVLLVEHYINLFVNVTSASKFIIETHSFTPI